MSRRSAAPSGLPVDDDVDPALSREHEVLGRALEVSGPGTARAAVGVRLDLQVGVPEAERTMRSDLYLRKRGTAGDDALAMARRPCSWR